MVSVQSTHTVFPSEPTPNVRLYSLCEQIKLRTHAPLLYVYNTHPPSTTLLNTLKNSLSQALVAFYPLAGRLSGLNGARWEIDCNAKGAQLVEANCEVKLKDLGDFVPSHLVAKLIPDIDYSNVPMEDTPLLVAQLTSFPCGGFTLGVALCRAAMDGTATMQFMSTWAKLARGKTLEPNEKTPCHDRSVLNSRGFDSVLQDHSEFRAPPPWLGPLGDSSEVEVMVVKLKEQQIEKLKKKVNENRGYCSARAYSTFEIVAGYLWRCVSKARYYGNREQPTRLSTLVNCRNRLKPPLNGNGNYAGNAAFPTVTEPSSFGEIMEKPLGYAVGNVRKAIERVNGDFVGSEIGYIRKVEDMDLVRYNFHYPAPSVHRGPYKGNPNLFVVSWMNFAFKDADFGWGKPVYFGPGYMDSEGKAFVVNSCDGDGVVVAVSLEASHVNAFKRFFHGDVEEEKLSLVSRL